MTALDDFRDDIDVQLYLANALNYFASLCAELAKEKGFHDDEQVIYDVLRNQYDSGNLTMESLQWFQDAAEQAEIARMVSELGEAVEGIRKPGPDSHCPDHPNVLVEYADTMIRIADTCGKRSQYPNIGDAVVSKLLYNMTRPRKHGKNS